MNSEKQKPDPITIKGRVFAGEGKASFFTQLDWVRAQSMEKTGFVPYPGTLNLEVLEEYLPVIREIRDLCALELIPPDKNFCTGKVLRARIRDIPASVILPQEEVHIHGKNVLEVMAPVNLRKTLGIKDGDTITLEIDRDGRNARDSLRDHGGAIVVEREVFPIDAVLFDLDGTLIDSTEAYFRIVEVALEEMGLPPAPRDVMLQAAENGSFNWPMLLPEFPEQELERVVRELWKIIAVVYPETFRTQVDLFPDARAAIEHLVEYGVPLAIITATQKANMKEKLRLLENQGVLHHFREIITSDDTEKRKPDPSPFLLCADRLKVPTQRCLSVGDKADDICAGKAAGMKTAAVLSGVDSHEMLIRERPDVIIDSVGGIMEIFFRAGRNEGFL